MDATGRPVQVTNAKSQVTKLAWDADNNVSSLTEDNGATTTWTYDPNTGYPLTHKDAQANKNGTAGTTYAYQTGLGGHIADLISKLTPQQRLWTFGYDANGNPTTYSSYDPNGYPQTITNPLANKTAFVYDVRGNVTSVTDPLNHVTTQAYDVFGRPGQKVVPKDQANGIYITTPAPVYDGNDNVTQATAPNGAITTTTYDPADEKAARFAPPDSTTAPQRETSYSYDPAGNLTSA